MNTRRFVTLALAGTVLAGIAASNNSTQAAGDSATYQVIFIPSWNPESHPSDYPITHGKKGLLTPMIGATHGADYQIWLTSMRSDVQSGRDLER